MQKLIDKAAVLIEALPYIRRFNDKTIVIKYGGHAMTDAELRRSFAVDVVLLKYIGLKPVIVHGGGPQIGSTLERLGRDSNFVRGMRVTDDATMEVVEMVLGGKLNQDIVELVNRGGGRAVGLTGIDGGMLQVRRRTVDGEDIGRVGEVVDVDPGPIAAATEAGFIPVIAPIGVDESGTTYNVNADEAAGEVASALEEGTIREGMIPKVECCITALRDGVPRAHIIDGRIQHALLLEIFTDGGVGTLLSH
jgi:acetylglutamate kinase